MKKKLFLRENKMTKIHYLQLKKEFKIRFTITIVLAIIASVFYIKILLSNSREVPYFIICIGTLILTNQSLIAPVFYKKKAAEEEHPEWKNLSTKGVEIPQEEIQKRNGIAILAFIIVIVGFFMLYRPAPKTDVGTEVIKTNSEIQSVPESSTDKESSTVSNLTPQDVQTLQELKEDIESNTPSDSPSLDINKAKDLAEKAQQQNWLKRDK